MKKKSLALLAAAGVGAYFLMRHKSVAPAVVEKSNLPPPNPEPPPPILASTKIPGIAPGLEPLSATQPMGALNLDDFGQITQICQPGYISVNGYCQPISGFGQQGGCQPGTKMNVYGVCQPDQASCPSGTVWGTIDPSQGPGGMHCLTAAEQSLLGRASQYPAACKAAGYDSFMPNLGGVGGKCVKTSSANLKVAACEASIASTGLSFNNGQIPNRVWTQQDYQKCTSVGGVFSQIHNMPTGNGYCNCPARTGDDVTENASTVYARIYGGGSANLCPPGYASNGYGGCTPTQAQCPTGYSLGAGNRCYPNSSQCPAGYQLNSYGQCVPLNPVSTCGAGFYLDATNRCVRSASTYQTYMGTEKNKKQCTNDGGTWIKKSGKQKAYCQMKRIVGAPALQYSGTSQCPAGSTPDSSGNCISSVTGAIVYSGVTPQITQPSIYSTTGPNIQPFSADEQAVLDNTAGTDYFTY